MKSALLILVVAASPLAAESKVYKALYRPAESLSQIIHPMGVQVNYNRQFNTITLNGSAENIKAAEAVLAQYDTPRRQAEFVIRVVEAGTGAQGPNDAADLVPAELKTLLKYTRFALLDSAILRGMEGDTLQIGLANHLGCHLRFGLRDSVIETYVRIQGPPMNIKNNTGNDTTHWPTILDTTATGKSGETVVLGASKMRGGANALIVLLTPKLLP